MLRLVVSVLLCLCASQSFAQSCPDFYRFVDFGLIDRDGVMVRGGVILRAEDFDGTRLLRTAQSNCTPVYEMAKDGRGNPIPVVAGVSFDPEQLSFAVTRLRMATVADTDIIAQQNIAAHALRLTQPDTEIVQGPNYLCAQSKGDTKTSCQFASGFQTNGALVVYCDVILCRVPVMAITDRIFVQAEWRNETTQARELGAVAARNLAQLSQIQGFLEPLLSGI